jgi:hypothetical protein
VVGLDPNFRLLMGATLPRQSNSWHDNQGVHVARNLHMSREPTFDFCRADGEHRLAELIIYVADKCADDPYFGAIKLNKILWNSDACSYAFYGEPITGVAYQKLPMGPAPKRFLPVKETLRERGHIVERRPQLGRFIQHRIVPLREPDLTVFDARDIAIVDNVIEFLADKNAGQASKQSHMRGWEMAKTKQDIPYEAIFLSDEGITEEDISRTQELNRELGWDDE